ncbi:MAG: precorrin-6y C5,15-methyltransferase (decarboxylating) subunit CbiE [Propionibacteriaceae bacterium]|nr:precorrin-6y C5,15-methyltransferase (decarboxylating) subunit CbiE [Propionibacteriaceae bacterium]
MIEVVGVPAGGLSELAPAQRDLVMSADVVVGGTRHLAMLPDPSRGVPWPSPLRAGLKGLFGRLGDNAVVLASGDPLLSGVATTLMTELGAERIRVHPALSSETLARARMLWPAETTGWVSLISREPQRVLAFAAPGERLIALSADQTTPVELARVLEAAGWGPSQLTVLGDLGTDRESRYATTAHELATHPGELPRLNVVAVEFATEAHPISRGPLLPDHAFHNDGQLTKQPLRLLALAALAPAPGQVLWDVGTGSGSISISWCRAADRTHAVAFDKREDRAARARSNAARLGVADRFEVHVGDVTTLLPDPALPRPDAVFFGGGANAETCAMALAALPVGGRLVVHSVTLETEALLAELHARFGGELTQVSFQTAKPLGAYRGWQPARAVTCYSLTKEAP